MKKNVIVLFLLLSSNVYSSDLSAVDYRVERMMYLAEREAENQLEEVTRQIFRDNPSLFYGIKGWDRHRHGHPLEMGGIGPNLIMSRFSRSRWIEDNKKNNNFTTTYCNIFINVDNSNHDGYTLGARKKLQIVFDLDKQAKLIYKSSDTLKRQGEVSIKNQKIMNEKLWKSFYSKIIKELRYYENSEREMRESEKKRFQYYFGRIKKYISNYKFGNEEKFVVNVEIIEYKTWFLSLSGVGPSQEYIEQLKNKGHINAANRYRKKEENKLKSLLDERVNKILSMKSKPKNS